MMLMLLPLAHAGEFLSPRCALENTPAPEPNSIAFHTDQDWFQLLSPATDRNYTMGLGLTLGGECARRLAGPLKVVNKLVGLEPSLIDSTRHRLSIVGSGYTPQDLRADDPLSSDRPYASLLLLNWQQVVWNEDDWNMYDPNSTRVLASARITELSLGALGLQVSPAVQTWIHDVMQENNGCVPYDETDEENCQPFRPDGWEHQISNGGEPTGRYGISWLTLLSEWPGAAHHRFYDLTLRRQLEVGYYTGANGGLTLRLGWIDSPFWSTLSTSPLGSVQEAAGARKRPLFEAYAFAGIGGRLVAYNALLQGQLRESAVTMTAQEIERLVWRYDLGAVARIGPVSLTYIADSGRTRELSIGDGHAHSWGTAGVSVEWPSKQRASSVVGEEPSTEGADGDLQTEPLGSSPDQEGEEAPTNSEGDDDE